MPMGIDQTLCSGWYSEQGGAARGRFKFSFHEHMCISLSRAVYRAGPGGGHKDRESPTHALRKSQSSREGSYPSGESGYRTDWNRGHNAVASDRQGRDYPAL